MEHPRQHPLWLRIILNLLAFAGLGVPLLGVIRPAWGIAVMGSAVVYLLWEFHPKMNSWIRWSPRLLLSVFIVCGALLGGFTYYLLRKSPTAAVGIPTVKQKRDDLYVRLSRRQTERGQVYADEFYAEMLYLTAEAEAANRHIPVAARREIRQVAEKRLAELEAMRHSAVAPHELEFSETIAQVRLAFPETPELDQLLDNTLQRPKWDIQNPNCDTRDVSCMQKWATAEGEKANTAIDECKQRVAALLAYMKAHNDG